MTQHINMFSGGLASAETAFRIAEAHGSDNLVNVFADTLIEDEDLYRFRDEVAAKVGGQMIVLTEGRDPWQVFFHVRFLGNTRIDPCSRILKREIIRKWLDANHNPDDAVIYLGFDWTETHRIEGGAKAWQPWHVETPLTAPPLFMKEDLGNRMRERGIEPPRLYALGFVHNNCGGFCVKAGQAQFARLLATLPDRYRYHERRELELIEYLGKKVTILRDRRGGQLTPMTLREFRERLEADRGDFDHQEWGGCGCFFNDAEAA